MATILFWPRCVNTLRPRQNCHHFADDTFNRIFVNENVRISIKFSLKFVPKGPINNILASVQIMAWRRPGDKPLSEPVMVSLLTHICVTLPQWVKVMYEGQWYVFIPQLTFQLEKLLDISKFPMTTNKNMSGKVWGGFVAWPQDSKGQFHQWLQCSESMSFINSFNYNKLLWVRSRRNYVCP